MIIRDWESHEDGAGRQVSADVDGFRVSFRAPRDYALSTNADPFFAVALLPAMVRGEPLEVEQSLTVSPTLLRHAALLQEIFHCWNPVLQIVPVTARTSPVEVSNTGVLSFFSGGVDSTYTLMKHADEITHGVSIFGFDFFDEHRADFDNVVRRNSEFLRSLGKTLIPVETNLYPFGYRYNLHRTLTMGAQLSAVALVLGFHRAYMPGSVSYNQLGPSGGHPLTDPLYSNDCVDVIHDGCEATRTEKLQFIAGSEAALANLQVCGDRLDVQCGRCDKCVRTMITLAAIGVSAPGFPPLPPPRAVRRQILDLKEKEMIFLPEIAAIPPGAGGTMERTIRRATRTYIRRHEFKEGLKRLDSALFGSRISGRRRQARMKRLPSGHLERVSAKPMKD